VPIDGRIVGRIGDVLSIVEIDGERCVATKAGAVLARGHTRWRAGAATKTNAQPGAEHRILLHEDLTVTTHYCPVSGQLLSVDFHLKGEPPADDVLLDLSRFTV
jgi:N-methylhydantoinase B